MGTLKMVIPASCVMGWQRSGTLFRSAVCREFFLFNDTATTEIYTLSLHDALPIWRGHRGLGGAEMRTRPDVRRKDVTKPEPSTRTAARAPRQARGRERREQLLDAAAALIAESGLAAVSMHAAAQRAGASIGSAYHFFRDKDQMLDALAERHDADRSSASCRREPIRSSGSPSRSA